MNEGIDNKKRTVYLIASIFFAIVIWFYMMVNINPIVRKTVVNVPVTFLNEEILESQNVTVMDSSQATIEVEVTGRQSDVYGLKADDIAASIDLKGYGSGSYQIPIEVEKGSAYTIQDYSPKTIYFVLDDIIEKQVPVAVEFQGSPQAQYCILAPVVEPEMITVRGPSETLADVTHALARVDAGGKKEDFQAVVTYSLVDETQEEVLGVSHAPATVRVSAEVELTREVTIAANVTGDLLAGYALSGISLEPDTIVIQGDPDRISRMEQVETMPININLLSQSAVREVQLDFPAGVHPNNGDQVLARIEVEPLEEMEIEIESGRVEFYQLASGLRAFTEPHVIHVAVQAPQSVIADLDQQDLRLYVNLQGVETGVYKLPIQGVLLVEGQMMSLVPNEMEVVVVDETQDESETSETVSDTGETSTEE